MGDKEILAELKECYEYLIDILDNADETQLNKADKNDLVDVTETLGEKYIKVYNEIKDRNDIELYYEEDVLIADEIGFDFMDTNKDYITSADLNEQKWWEDSDFIYEF